MLVYCVQIVRSPQYKFVLGNHLPHTNSKRQWEIESSLSDIVFYSPDRSRTALDLRTNLEVLSKR